MVENETNAQRFLTAFADIEEILARQQGRRDDRNDWAPFSDLVSNSDTLLLSQKDQLRAFAKLRNAISHKGYLNGAPIADPREDTVDAITKLHRHLERPPLLIDALRDYGQPRIFLPDDDIGEFLELVTIMDFSQAPVRADSGHRLITTNAVARWFASNLIEHGGVVESTPIEKVLAFAETGDRVLGVIPTTTTVQAINLLSGQAEAGLEPPAALLLLGKVGQSPQRICSRADLAVLYAQMQA
ncbi:MULTISPECIES: hypothetical protein [unclassified Leucobacter]|uniref:hypothetical protein n=1 Tax=unclassified Leucobacter TaxID=2621730 RepID=UPI00165DEA35|nr:MULTISPECIES: hypothetical protein [unclassified Leucobacter]MBC9927854.1 hypothetical protein [Leucobacter sp. cx-169]